MGMSPDEVVRYEVIPQLFADYGRVPHLLESPDLTKKVLHKLTATCLEMGICISILDESKGLVLVTPTTNAKQVNCQGEVYIRTLWLSAADEEPVIH